MGKTAIVAPLPQGRALGCGVGKQEQVRNVLAARARCRLLAQAEVLPSEQCQRLEDDLVFGDRFVRSAVGVKRDEDGTQAVDEGVERGVAEPAPHRRVEDAASKEILSEELP